MEDPEEPEPKKIKGSSAGVQDLREAEDGTLGTDAAPEDVTRLCFLSVTELSGGKGENVTEFGVLVVLVGGICVCISWNRTFAEARQNLH